MALHLVDFRKRARDYLRRTLLRAVVETLESEQNPCGFALVVWDDKGVATISYDTTHGPIRTRMMPEHVKAALVGQLIIDDAAWQLLPRDKR